VGGRPLGDVGGHDVDDKLMMMMVMVGVMMIMVMSTAT
jgi:hypothetical protein